MRVIPISIVDLCFKLPNWHWWMKLLEITWNCSLSPITFLNSLLIVLSKTIGQKVLRVLYDSLLGLGIMIINETLKCNGQWSNSMHTLAISINFLRHVASLTYLLRYLHDNLSGSRVNELLHFTIALVNSSSKKWFYFIVDLLIISSSKFKSISQLSQVKRKMKCLPKIFKFNI